MTTQVISVAPDGTVSGLQRKPGQGLDLRQFGKADIQRASLIEWAEDVQAWFIDVLQDAGRGPVSYRRWIEAVGTVEPEGFVGAANYVDDRPMLFAEYDDAVKAEIAYLDALRLQGQF